MSAPIRFTKLEGLGNDFVLIDHFFDLEKSGEVLKKTGAGLLPVTPELARALLDRRFGIGGDQLLWLKPAHDARDADARMEILNPDGSTAEMCGNGIRAFAVYFHKRVAARKTHYRFETLAGTKAVEMKGARIRVDMGPPVLGKGFTGSGGGEELALLGAHVRFFEVNMGNPHAVFFTEKLEEPLEELPGLGASAVGSAVERHPRFESRTNVEFVKVEADGSLRVTVWERGTGLTLACGSGACASAVSAIQSGRVKADGSPIRVLLPGGELQVSWQSPGSVWMEGPAREVFSGLTEPERTACFSADS